MGMLEIVHSNRVEALLQALAESISVPPDDPFQPEVILVQNQGMARWIDQQLAGKRGISAATDYPLPASFFWRILTAWLPQAPESSLFDKDALLWRLQRLRPHQLSEPAFQPLQQYLAAEGAAHRQFQLARRIADLFDQYLVFRPDMVLAWEQGSEGHWQAELWRALCAEADHAHRARLFADLERAMARSAPTPGGLPHRVSLFGLSALAPVYVRMLGALAAHLPVHLFLLNPCREYWADLEDVRGQARRRARARRAGLPDPTGLLDVGNPLLASFGHAGQVFLDQLLELGGIDHDAFVSVAGDGLLHQVQQDLLELRNPAELPQGTVPAEDDDSIQLHVCHSQLREVQVLHDRLLSLFQRESDLEPRDIVVMAPDIDQYAPYVEAVFGAAPAAMRIPWSIADRCLAAEQPLLDALRQLLELPRSRFEASELVSLLEVEAVRRRFGLDQAGIGRIRTWVRESGIRWGEDAVMREGLGLPGEAANTWDFGLVRLFFGYALPPEPEPPVFAGILPYPDIEGSEAVYLGQLQAFIDVLGSWRKRLQNSYRLDDWRQLFDQLLASLFAPDESEEPVLQRLRDRLDEMVALARNCGYDQPLPLDVMRELLEGLFEETQGAQRFLSGRVSFCNMVPMRSIPFRVVCLIGMSGEAFPRSQQPLSFDLMAQAPRRGDRSRRRDDRYLFLEAMLSARDVFYISYVGRDARDNGVRVPSVVVDELLEYLDQGYGAGGNGSLASRLLLQHPLQPFNRRYFDGSERRLFSYAATWSAAARVIPEVSVRDFAETSLAPPNDPLKSVDVEELIRFLRHPSSYFLTQRLRLKLPSEDDPLADDEPFDCTGLERYQLRQTLLQLRQAGNDEQEALARLRAEGSLPQGVPGDLVFEEQWQEITPFLERLQQHADPPVDPLEVDLRLGEFRLQGRLSGLGQRGLLRFRCGRLSCRDRLAVWVWHLVLNTLAPAGIDPVSRLVAEDFTLHLLPVGAAEGKLHDLLLLRWQGLSSPLAFFPESSLAWMKNEAYDSAFYQVWNGEFNPLAEANDLSLRIAFRGRDPIGLAFRRATRCILRPMLDHSELVKAEQELNPPPSRIQDGEGGLI